jgi:hypothetical protein
MGKVTYKELPKDHPIFKAGWLISSTKKYSQKKYINNNKRQLTRKR